MTKIMNLPEFRSFCEHGGIGRFYYNSSNDGQDGDHFNFCVSFPKPDVFPSSRSVCFSEGKSNRLFLGEISKVIYMESDAGVKRISFECAQNFRYTFHVL